MGAISSKLLLPQTFIEYGCDRCNVLYNINHAHILFNTAKKEGKQAVYDHDYCLLSTIRTLAFKNMYLGPLAGNKQAMKSLHIKFRNSNKSWTIIKTNVFYEVEQLSGLSAWNLSNTH